MTTIAVSGTSGYLGGYLADFLKRRAGSVIPLRRQPASSAILFDLRNPAVDPEEFRNFDVKTLVHCAYDFVPRSPEDIHRVNVGGTIRLFEAAQAGGVERMVLVSSLSSYDGARSLYGRAKLAQERAVTSMGGICLRPGLIWGNGKGGMMGTLSRLVERLPVVPLIGGGEREQFLTNIDDLAQAIAFLSMEPHNLAGTIIPIAYPESQTMRAILGELARQAGTAPVFLTAPWRLVWLAIRLLEAAVPGCSLRSDSVIGLIHADESPLFSPALLEALVGHQLLRFPGSRA